MKATGVALVVLSALIALTAVAGQLTDKPVSGTTIVIAAILGVGGLIVWSLQQIREALIGGHPRDIKARLASRNAKAERNA